jgi:hypothetical protein
MVETCLLYHGMPSVCKLHLVQCLFLWLLFIKLIYILKAIYKKGIGDWVFDV